MKKRKGIILAGGSGTRLHPASMVVSKHLLPVYNKPLIYYPLSVLMLAGISEIIIITKPEDQKLFQRLLGDGSRWGINLTFALQQNPDGLAQAYIIAEEFLDGSPSTLILGDNIFFGHELKEILSLASNRQTGATVFGYQVKRPENFGVIGFANTGEVVSLVEKPKKPASNYALTGLYFADETASARAKHIKPSVRGELEITSLLDSYLKEQLISVQCLDSGIAWFDAGTHESLLDAGNFVRTLEERQGLIVGSPDDIAN